MIEKQDGNTIHDEILDHFALRISDKVRSTKLLVEFCEAATFAIGAYAAAIEFAKRCLSDCTPGTALGAISMFGLYVCLFFPLAAATELTIKSFAVSIQKRLGVMPLEDEPRILIRSYATAFVYTVVLASTFNLANAFRQMVGIAVSH